MLTEITHTIKLCRVFVSDVYIKKIMIVRLLNFLGMLFSSIVSGLLTGAFGRKFFLIFGFSGVFVFNLVAGSSQTFEILVTAKFFEGLL